MKTRNHILWIIRFAIASVAYIAISAALIAAFGPPDSSEFGPIETAQHLILIGSIVLWILAARHLFATPEPMRSFDPHIAIGFVIVNYIALGREVTWLRVYGFGFDKQLEWFSAIICLAGLIYLAYRWFFKTNGWFGESLKFIGAPSFMFLVICFCLGILGEAIEKKVLVLEPRQILEELAELWGYIALIFAPLAAFSTRITARSE